MVLANPPIWAASVPGFSSQPQRLWYTQPAGQWLEALPLGNGYMGAMVFGKVKHERIALNESSFWSGKPHDYSNPEALTYFPRIRELVVAGKFQEAEKMADAHFFGLPAAQQAFEPLGDLWLDFDGPEKSEDYQRELDLETGIAKVTYRIGQQTWHREMFMSYPDHVLVIHLRSDQPGKINVTARTSSEFLDRVVAQGHELVMDGVWRAPAEKDWLIAPVEGRGLHFQTRLAAQTKGGLVTGKGGRLSIQGADEVTFLLTAATSYKNYSDIGGDPEVF
ncbi:MAG TPA: glycoside hydrolase family 95 protein, partial [Verrucomicrobiae bacterium]